jgi:hypothetical protein
MAGNKKGSARPEDAAKLFGSGSLFDAASKLFTGKKEKEMQLKDLDKQLGKNSRNRGYHK